MKAGGSDPALALVLTLGKFKPLACQSRVCGSSEALSEGAAK
jgi:hypothetical protein